MGSYSVSECDREALHIWNVDISKCCTTGNLRDPQYGRYFAN